jgi:hypothetical protein
LVVKGRAAMTGYSRAAFGQAWADVDRNGCDTRNDVLRRDLRSTVIAGNGCVVRSGTLPDPYSGRSVGWWSGGETVQIDHVVALADAWVKGAQGWTAKRRTAFANDPLNLLATLGSENAAKKNSDAASWLPPKVDYRCRYVARQIAVKRAYGLSVTRAEHDAMVRILARSPGQTLPTAASVAVPAMRTGSDPRFASCAAAKTAGYGPYRRGIDPEYGWYRDVDNDGVVCE